MQDHCGDKRNRLRRDDGLEGREPRLRTRGVRALRASFGRALIRPGFGPVALTERMADREGLVALPRGLVSRIFGDKPVDPRLLESLARALGVAAHTLDPTGAELSPRAEATMMGSFGRAITHTDKALEVVITSNVPG